MVTSTRSQNETTYMGIPLSKFSNWEKEILLKLKVNMSKEINDIALAKAQNNTHPLRFQQVVDLGFFIPENQLSDEIVVADSNNARLHLTTKSYITTFPYSEIQALTSPHTVSFAARLFYQEVADQFCTCRTDNENLNAHDNTYRLYTRVTANVLCSGNQISGTIETPVTHVGSEGELMPPEGTLLLPHDGIRNDKYELTYLFMGRPHNLAELAFQNIRLRQSYYIWHQPIYQFSCKNNQIVLKYILNKSNFPSTSMFVDGMSINFRGQGNVRQLWESHPFNEHLCMGNPIFI